MPRVRDTLTSVRGPRMNRNTRTTVVSVPPAWRGPLPRPGKATVR